MQSMVGWRTKKQMQERRQTKQQQASSLQTGFYSDKLKENKKRACSHFENSKDSKYP